MSAYSAAYLGPAIDSVLGQTYRDFEFIIVDDSANPATQALLDRYAASDTRIVLERNERNLGQTLSLNKGLSLPPGVDIKIRVLAATSS